MDKKEQILLNEGYFKYYQLNDEGIRKYGELKKKQHLVTLKWSFLGTTFGVLGAKLIDVSLKKTEFAKRDVYKAIFLVISSVFFTYNGYRISSYNFEKEKNELCKEYGEEINK